MPTTFPTAALHELLYYERMQVHAVRSVEQPALREGSRARTVLPLCAALWLIACGNAVRIDDVSIADAGTHKPDVTASAGGAPHASDASQSGVVDAGDTMPDASAAGGGAGGASGEPSNSGAAMSRPMVSNPAAAGAPAAGEPSESPPKSAPDAGSVASGGAGAPAPADAFWPEDCEQRMVFKAHGVGMPGDTSKYRVAAGAQHLVLFRFKAPWQGDMQLLAARMLFDNTKVMHHWTLFVIDDASVRDGEIVRGPAQDNLITVLDAFPLMSVGPGATDMQLPPDVGLRVPSGENVAIALELHYFNVTDAEQEDASGVEVCLTSKKRPKDAAVHGLGRIAFVLPAHQKTDVSSTCEPLRQREPVYIREAIPHMHLTGRHMKLVVNRKSGERLTLLEVDYMPQEQRSYPLAKDGPFVLEAGDTLTTTCTFENTNDLPVLAGARIEDEMCTISLLAWPTGVLTNGQFSGVFLGTPEDINCMEL